MTVTIEQRFDCIAVVVPSGKAVTFQTQAAAEQYAAACERYLTLRAQMDRLDAAESRAFGRYMRGEGSAATARKAKSRVDRLSADFAGAKLDAVSDDGDLPDGRGWYD